MFEKYLRYNKTMLLIPYVFLMMIYTYTYTLFDDVTMFTMLRQCLFLAVLGMFISAQSLKLIMAVKVKINIVTLLVLGLIVSISFLGAFSACLFVVNVKLAPTIAFVVAAFIYWLLLMCFRTINMKNYEEKPQVK